MTHFPLEPGTVAMINVIKLLCQWLRWRNEMKIMHQNPPTQFTSAAFFCNLQAPACETSVGDHLEWSRHKIGRRGAVAWFDLHQTASLVAYTGPNKTWDRRVSLTFIFVPTQDSLAVDIVSTFEQSAEILTKVIYICTATWSSITARRPENCHSEWYQLHIPLWSGLEQILVHSIAAFDHFSSGQRKNSVSK